jgi:hypothetical protein
MGPKPASIPLTTDYTDFTDGHPILAAALQEGAEDRENLGEILPVLRDLL